jgi:hypothetical protein
MREPLKMTKLPEGPWQELSADFYGPFKTGEYLLVIVDDFSRFPEVEIVHSLSSNAIIPRFDAIFARQGVPSIVKTDNGPPFNGEAFKKWGQTIGFDHRKVTPLWPRANGEAERMMDTLGKAVRTAMPERWSWKQEMYRFLRHYRATPHSTTGKSPAELLNGRKLLTDLPSVLKPQKFSENVDILKRRDERMKQYMKQLADARNHAHPLNLDVGDHVLVKQDQKNKLDTPFKPQPYQIESRKGSMITASNNESKITRNVSFFKKISPTCGQMNDHEMQDTLDTPVTGNQPVPPVHHTDNMDVETESDAHVTDEPELRRSTRIKTTPAHLKDFV